MQTSDTKAILVWFNEVPVEEDNMICSSMHIKTILLLNGKLSAIIIYDIYYMLTLYVNAQFCFINHCTSNLLHYILLLIP